MKKCNKTFRVLLHMFMPILAALLFTSYIFQSSYAFSVTNSPNVIITINSDGSLTQEGDLFGHGLLYPSKVEDAEKGIGGISGVIRITNHFRKVTVDGMGMKIAKDKMVASNPYPLDIVYDSFLDSISIKIEKGSLFNFDNTLTDYTRLRKLLYESDKNETSGMLLSPEKWFHIYQGRSVDLKYTLHMDEDTKEELESVKANVLVQINFSGMEQSEEKEPPEETEKPKETGTPNVTDPLVESKPTGNLELTKETPVPAAAPPETVSTYEIIDEDDDAPGGAIEVMLNDDQMIGGGGNLPRTGEIAPILFYTVGSLLIGLGIYMRIRKSRT